MFESSVNVKFMGVEERSGTKDGKPWSMKEAIIFIQEFGRVKVPVHDRNAAVTLPEVNSVGKLRLSVSAGKFNALNLVWDSQSLFTPATKAA